MSSAMDAAAEGGPMAVGQARQGVVWARLLVGAIVLICAEAFSGASLGMGLWHPWTLGLTYWLYFAHFFLFTTLAVRTGRTSLSALYLWGVLFGLYESWFTKVIWAGYEGNGTLALGPLGPFGYSEISMVFYFHPVMSFIVPLAVACVLLPALRRHFPGLAWMTGRGRRARIAQGYFVITAAAPMAVNAGGLANLALNLTFALAVTAVLLRLARPARAAVDATAVVAFSSRGFVGLCIYLVLLYALGYFGVRWEALPSAGLQAFTFVFYAVAIAGLALHRRRGPNEAAEVGPDEAGRVVRVFGLILGVGLVLSPLGQGPALYAIVGPLLLLWTPLGFILTAFALLRGAREAAGKDTA